jgi:hypothetical protein
LQFFVENRWLTKEEEAVVVYVAVDMVVAYLWIHHHPYS